MTMERTPPTRERLDIEPLRVLATLPSMGKVMVASSERGVTHERIGPVEAVSSEGLFIRVSGPSHDSRIDPREIANIIADRSGRMGEKVFPRIDFQTSDDAVLFSVVGFEGIEPFDAALASLGAGTPLEAAPGKPAGERGEVVESDPGALPFSRASASGEATTIGFHREGFEQRWRGRIETVKPAMGFINIIQPDFHMHLKAGAVTGWRQDGDRLFAIAPDGSLLGLFVAPEPR